MRRLSLLTLLSYLALSAKWYDSTAIPLVSPTELSSLILSRAFVLVEFYSNRCPACEHYSP